MKSKLNKIMKLDISKFYILILSIICLILIGGYFSYAMFTVSKEQDNAISIVTGNLVYSLSIDGEEGNTLVIPANTTKEFEITLSNPNNIKARFNFYYVGNLEDGVSVNYLTSDGVNTPPSEVGINLEKTGTSGSVNIYTIRVENNSNNDTNITLGVQVGLDYNDLSLPEDGHLFTEYTGIQVASILDNLTSGNTYDDGTNTFITGESPNNYVLYSNILWRVISVNNSYKTVKLVTDENVNTLIFDENNSTFSSSYIESWLNDVTVDGFLSNLNNYENYLVLDASFDTSTNNTELGNITKPSGSTTVTDIVGLLNTYEYQMSYENSTSYLNNNTSWWTITPYDSSNIACIDNSGNISSCSKEIANGVRPSINLKSNVGIISGDGTKDNPYRLYGDEN